MRVRDAIWDAMGDAYGIIKSGDGMNRGLDRLAAIRAQRIPGMAPASRSRRYNTGWLDALEY